MPLLRLANNYNRLPDGELIIKAVSVHTNLRDNPQVFEQPRPTLTVFKAAIDDFTRAQIVSLDGSRLAAAHKNGLRRELIELLYKVGYYVLHVSDGDPIIVLLAGLDLIKEASTITMPAPRQPVLRNSEQQGWLEVEAGVVKGAKSYRYEYTTDPDFTKAFWKGETLSTATHILKGLIPGQKYYVRVHAIGTNGQSKVSVVNWRVVS